MSKEIYTKLLEQRAKGGDEPNIPQWMVPYVAGVAAGMADTLLNFPPYGLHYRKQRGRNIRPWVNPQFYKPAALYCGLVPYSFIIPVTCLTDGLSDWLKAQNVPGVFATMLSGFVAGAVISTPTSNIIIQQQMAAERKAPKGIEPGSAAHHKFDAARKNAATPVATVQRLYAQDGLWRFTRGMPTLMMREAAYAMAVFWGKDEVLERFPTLKEMGWWGFGIACTVSGIGSTMISQPMDVMTTWAIKSERRLTVAETFRQMYAEDGLKRFYSGTLMRGYAIIAGIAVMSLVSDYVKERMNKKE